VRFLSCMNSLMISEVRFLEEGFSTFSAYMRFICLLSSLR
jgi:hypothetical protein